MFGANLTSEFTSALFGQSCGRHETRLFFDFRELTTGFTSALVGQACDRYETGFFRFSRVNNTRNIIITLITQLKTDYFDLTSFCTLHMDTVGCPVYSQSLGL